MRAKLRTLRPSIKPFDGRAVQPEAKAVDPFYLTPAYQAWRELVIARAGRQCQAINDNGKRCSKAEPAHRMFADHIEERKDAGLDLDPANGQALCGRHHTLKTTQARARRFALPSR